MSTWKKVITEANTIGDLANVDDSGTTTNYVLTWNGTDWVAAAAGASFTPAVNTSNSDYNTAYDSDLVSSTGSDSNLIWIGSAGDLIAVDTMDSVIDFDNVAAQPTAGELDIDIHDGSSSTSLTGIDLTSGGPGVWDSGTGTLTFTNENPVVVKPSISEFGTEKGWGAYIKFSLKSITVEGVGLSTSFSRYLKLANKVYIGTTTETSAATMDANEVCVVAGTTQALNTSTTNWLGNLSASETKTWDASPSAGAGERIFFACPSRLVAGDNTLGFNMAGIPFDFQDPVTIANVGNAGEDYEVYVSSNSGLGPHTFITSRA